jgi:hypothetical protein
LTAHRGALSDGFGACHTEASEAKEESQMLHNRLVWALLSVLVGGLQAWDSGVFQAGSTVQALAIAGVLLPALALWFAERWDIWLFALIAGAVLLTAARLVSPVSLNTLHIGLMVPAMYVFFVCRLERRIGSSVDR